MTNEKLIKDGKVFNMETSTPIAVSQWYTHRKVQRQKIYKTTKGTFFKVTEQPKFSMDCPSILLQGGGKVRNISVGKYYLNTGNGFRDDVLIDSVEVDSVITEQEARYIFEYTLRGKEYAVSHHCHIKYKLLLPYIKIFKLTEA